MKILGINYGGHDTSACITINGKVVAACEQERYDHEKHSRNFPKQAILDCFKISKININDIDILSFSNDPYLQIKEKYLKLALTSKNRVEFLCQSFPNVIIIE